MRLESSVDNEDVLLTMLSGTDLMQAILERYHEEQVWSDKVRSVSLQPFCQPLLTALRGRARFAPFRRTVPSPSPPSTSSFSSSPSFSSSHGDDGSWSSEWRNGTSQLYLVLFPPT